MHQCLFTLKGKVCHDIPWRAFPNYLCSPRSFVNKYNMPDCKVQKKPETKLFKCLTGVLKWFQGLITYTLLGKKALKFSMGKVILSGKIKPALQAANKMFSLSLKQKKNHT